MGFGSSIGVSPYRSIMALNSITSLLEKSLTRVSTGYRVTSAADDPAGLAVATKFSTRARSGNQAIRNINNGISLVQTAESAMSEVGSILDRMRELAVQSSSGTLSASQRTIIDDEFNDLSAEVDRLAAATEFNGIQLTDGSVTSRDVQVGIDAGASSQITVTMSDLTTSTLGVDTSTIDLSTAATALTAITDIDTAIDTVSGYLSSAGASQNRLDSAGSYMTSYVTSMESARSSIMDVDLAHETAEIARLQLLQAAGVAALVQARNINESLLSLLP